MAAPRPRRFGKKFPKVRVDILSSGTKNTNFSVWLNNGRQPLSERYRFPDMGRRMVGTQDFNIGGTKLAVFAIGMEDGPSEFVEVAVYGVARFRRSRFRTRMLITKLSFLAKIREVRVG